LKTIWDERELSKVTAKDYERALEVHIGLDPDPKVRVNILGPISPTYMYSPLNVARKEIRLVVLLPGEWNDPVRVRLKLETLNESLQYEALSYCWGNRDKKSLIYVDGRGFGVTVNLWAALRHRRSQKSPRTMWIDAICINQTDLGERSNQVMMMRDIYQQADQVVAWLGSETEATGSLLKDLNRNAADILKESELLSLSKSLGAEVLDNIWTTLSSDLLARPYWQRLWIHQEIALAGRIEVVCGDSSVEWNLLIATVKLGIRYLASIQTAYLITRGVTEVAKERLLQVLELDQLRIQHRLPMSQSISITELLGRLQKFQATDKRDKIFGLFGLWDQKKYVVPNYQTSVGQVYFDFARNIIIKDHSLDVITRSTIRDIIYGSDLLPSWVPDWSIDPACHPLNLEIQIGKDHTSKPFSGFKLFPASISFSENYRTLKVEGIIFDRIQSMNPSPYSNPASGIFNFVAAAINTALSSGGPLYPNGEDIKLAVSRTLSADLDWKQDRCRSGQMFWDIFEDSYKKPPEDYRPDAPNNERLEMLRMMVGAS
jgi:hypothetical protein